METYPAKEVLRAFWGWGLKRLRVWSRWYYKGVFASILPSCRCHALEGLKLEKRSWWSLCIEPSQPAPKEPKGIIIFKQCLQGYFREYLNLLPYCTHTISTCLKLLLLSDDAQWNFRGDKWQCDPNFMGHWWWSSSLETTCVRSSFLVTINPAFFINTPSYYTPLWTWKNLEFLIENCS